MNFFKKYIKTFLISISPLIIFCIYLFISNTLVIKTDLNVYLLILAASLFSIINIMLAIKMEKNIKRRLALIFLMPPLYIFISILVMFFFIISLDWSKFHM